MLDFHTFRCQSNNCSIHRLEFVPYCDGVMCHKFEKLRMAVEVLICQVIDVSSVVGASCMFGLPHLAIHKFSESMTNELL